MIQATIVIVYFAIIFGIALYMSRQQDGIDDFLVAKRQMGILAIIPMLFSEFIAGSSTIGNAAIAYKIGLAATWYNFGIAIGCVLTVVFVSKFYRVMACKGKMSVGEAIAEYFDERTSVVMVLITAVVYMIIYALQPAAAAGILSPMLGISPKICVWIVGITFIVNAAMGGIKGIAKVNFIHALVIYFGLGIAAFLSIRHVGGIQTLVTVLPKEDFDMFRPGVFTVIAWVAGASINMPAGSLVAGVIFGADSLKTARRGLITAGLLLIPFSFMVAGIGMSAKVAGLDISGNNAIYAMTAEISPVLSGIASMAILAAILSTAPMLLMMVGGTLTRDVYKRFINPQASSKQQMLFSRICIIALGVIGTYFGSSGGALLTNLLGALQIRSVAGLVLMISMVWKAVDSRAAFWSISVGGLVASIWFFAGKPYGIEPLWPSMAIASIILIALTVTAGRSVHVGREAYTKDLVTLSQEI